MRSLGCFVVATLLLSYVCYAGHEAKHLNMMVRQSSYPALTSLALSLSISLSGLGTLIGGVSGLYLLRRR